VAAEFAFAQPGARQDIALLFGPPPGYSQPLYSQPVAAGSDYVFFEGEPISLKVSLANWSARVLTLRTQGVEVAEAVNVELISAGSGEMRSRDATLRLSRELLIYSESAAIAAAWGVDVVLQPKWYVSSVADLEIAAPLPAGSYRLKMIDAGVGCEPQCSVTMGGSGEFRFVVRAVLGLTEQLDRLMKRAYRSLMLGEYAEVDGHLGEVLKLYPAASAAYQALGRKAEALGRPEEAADAFERGAQLLERGEDVLRPAASARAAFGSMRSDAQAARAAAKSRTR
jgi:tetratricopeptide (TPR) repeat protein